MNNIDFIQGVFLKRLSLLHKPQIQDHERHDSLESPATGLLGPYGVHEYCPSHSTSSLRLRQNEVQCSLLDTWLSQPMN